MFGNPAFVQMAEHWGFQAADNEEPQGTLQWREPSPGAGAIMFGSPLRGVRVISDPVFKSRDPAAQQFMLAQMQERFWDLYVRAMEAGHRGAPPPSPAGPPRLPPSSPRKRRARR